MNVAAGSDHLVGAWDWDVVNDRVYADAKFASMFGNRTRRGGSRTSGQLLDSGHSSGRPRARCNRS